MDMDLMPNLTKNSLIHYDVTSAFVYQIQLLI